MFALDEDPFLAVVLVIVVLLCYFLLLLFLVVSCFGYLRVPTSLKALNSSLMYI